MRDQLGEVQAPPRAVAGLVEVEETVHRLQKAGRAPELRGVGLVWVLQLVQVQVQEQKMTVTGRHYPLMAALVPVLEDEEPVEEHPTVQVQVQEQEGTATRQHYP